MFRLQLTSSNTSLNAVKNNLFGLVSWKLVVTMVLRSDGNSVCICVVITVVLTAQGICSDREQSQIKKKKIRIDLIPSYARTMTGVTG